MRRSLLSVVLAGVSVIAVQACAGVPLRPAHVQPAALDDVGPAIQLASLTLTRAGNAGSGVTPVVFSTSTGALFDKSVTLSTGTSCSPICTQVAPTGGSDTSEATLSFWLRGTRANDGPAGSTDLSGSASTSTLNNIALLGTGPRNSAVNACETGAGTAKGWCIAPVDNGASGALYNFNDSLGTSTAHGITISGSNQALSLANGVWNFLIVGYKQNHCFLTNVTTGMTDNCPPNITGVVTNNLFSTDGMFIWSALSGTTSFGYLQDVYLNQHYLGCSGTGSQSIQGITALCPVDNTIPDEVLAKFVSGGKAVDLGTNCTGPTGLQPAICLTGGAAGMAVNKGYVAGLSLHTPASTVVQALATGAGLYDSPYGATGIVAHQVTLKHLFYNPAPSQSGPIAGGGCATNATTGCTYAYSNEGVIDRPNSGGQPLAVGDLRILIGNLDAFNAPTGSHDGAAHCPTTDGTAWTLLAASGPAFDSTSGQYSFVCYKFVTSGAEPDYLLATPQGSIVSWTGIFSPVQWTMLTYTNVASVQDARAIVRSTTSTTLSTPTFNVGASACKLVSIWTNAEGASTTTYTYGGTGTVRLPGINFQGPMTEVVDEDVAAGSAAQRDLTRGTSIHSQSENFSLCLVPN